MWTYEANGHLFTDTAQATTKKNYAVVQGNTDSENRAVYREHNKKTSGDNWY
jgi:hypothetical protein